MNVNGTGRTPYLQQVGMIVCTEKNNLHGIIYPPLSARTLPFIFCRHFIGSLLTIVTSPHIHSSSYPTPRLSFAYFLLMPSAPLSVVVHNRVSIIESTEILYIDYS